MATRTILSRVRDALDHLNGRVEEIRRDSSLRANWITPDLEASR